MGFAMWSERVDGRTMVFSCAPLVPECILVPFPERRPFPVRPSPGGDSKMDTHLNVPISTITTTLNRLAKRAGSPQEKAHLYEIVQGIGDAIAAGNPGLKVDEFVQACGVSPTWAQQAA